MTQRWPLFNFVLLWMLLFTQGSAAAAPLALTDSEREYLASKQSFKVCIDPDWMPNEKISPSGEYLGISSDYMALFADLLGVPIVLHPTTSWRQTLEAAQLRQCDLVSLINRSAEREQYLNFSDPYLSYAYSLMAQVGAPFVDDLAFYTEERFSVVKGYLVGKKIKEVYPNLNLVEVDSTLDGLKRVLIGEVFAHIDTSVVQTYVMNVHGLQGLQPVGSLPWQSSMSLATRSDEPLLASVFQKAIDSLLPREHNRIRNKWIALTIEKVFDTRLFIQIISAAGLFALFVAVWGITLWRSRQALQQANAQLEIQSQELKKLATIDSLTEILNRRALLVKLDEAMDRFARYQRGFGVILIDIDHFKKVNDHYGHQAGDTVLQTFSKLLVTSSRATDCVGRWGGEEFLVLCPETDRPSLQALAEKLCKLIDEYHFPLVEHCTASFGLSVFEEGDTQAGLLERADQALYCAKENGRNQVQLV